MKLPPLFYVCAMFALAICAAVLFLMGEVPLSYLISNPLVPQVTPLAFPLSKRESLILEAAPPVKACSKMAHASTAENLSVDKLSDGPDVPEAIARRQEVRRAVQALVSDFRDSSKCQHDWETTSKSALFHPDGRTKDPYSLPMLQLPTVLTIENPEIEITTDTQVSEWERLQDEFLVEVGSELPKNAAARMIWIKAQRKSDDKFRLKFGTEAFLKQQMDAYRNGFLQQ